jgi:glucokinase
MLLAADVGGTKTLLGLFEQAPGRPRPVLTCEYSTARFDSLSAMIDAFARDAGAPLRVDAAVAGVAGPVVNDFSRLTNVAWSVASAEIALHLATRARLLNDLEAMAYGAAVMTPEELVTLQDGVPRVQGNAAVIAAGTGLGQAYLHRVSGRVRPLASEGGHADFAPRTDRQVELFRMLRARYGRAEVEHVLSGPGLLNLHAFTHAGGTCVEVPDVTSPGAPAAVSDAALGGRCAQCVEALMLFVEIFGAEAGNLALRAMATAGVYLGGGMAPKILPALRGDRFLAAFRDKGVMSTLVSEIPVRVLLNADAGLIGAAVYAQELAES